MSPLILIYTTCPTLDEARSLAKALIEKRLVACVNISSPLESLYEWKGKLETTTEYGLLLKTTKARLNEIKEILPSLHSYDSPCFMVLDAKTSLPAFEKWVVEQTFS